VSAALAEGCALLSVILVVFLIYFFHYRKPNMIVYKVYMLHRTNTSKHTHTHTERERERERERASE